MIWSLISWVQCSGSHQSHIHGNTTGSLTSIWVPFPILNTHRYLKKRWYILLFLGGSNKYFHNWSLFSVEFFFTHQVKISSEQSPQFFYMDGRENNSFNSVFFLSRIFLAKNAFAPIYSHVALSAISTWFTSVWSLQWQCTSSPIRSVLSPICFWGFSWEH